MRMDDYIVAMLARRIWQEAQRVPPAAQRQFGTAVGLCLRNRVSGDASWLYVLSNSIVEGVVTEPVQEHDPLLLWAIWEAESIYMNQKADQTDGATDWTWKIPAGGGSTSWPEGFYTYQQKSC